MTPPPGQPGPETRCPETLPPVILGIDTSAGQCAVVILRGDDIRARRAEAMERGHAERLFPMIEEALAAAGLGYGDLARVAVCTGPGSFTGIRVGVAAARGLALGLGVPATGITRFEALAANAVRRAERFAWAEGEVAFIGQPIPPPPAAAAVRVAVAIAMRGTVLLQPFDARSPTALEALDEPRAASAGMLAAAEGIRVGDGWGEPGGDGGAGGCADPADVARLAAARGPGGPPAPFYLREADAAPPRVGPPARLD